MALILTMVDTPYTKEALKLEAPVLHILHYKNIKVNIQVIIVTVS